MSLQIPFRRGRQWQSPPSALIARAFLYSAVALSLLLALASTSAAAPVSSYHVAKSGNDTNSGTVQAPWRTLQKAADSVPVGATVVVHSGTYAGFTMTRSGTSSQPIVFMGAPSESRPVIDGTIGSRVDVVRFAGDHDIVFEGFVVKNAQGQPFSGSGVKTDSSAHDITIADSLITDNQSFGIYPLKSNHITIRGNEISHNAAGIYVSYDGEGDHIYANDIHNTDRMIRNTVGGNDDAGGDAIVFHNSDGHVLVENNRIWGNRAQSYDYGWDGGGLTIYGASNITFRDNLLWDNENIMETGTDGTNGLPCANNVFVRNVAWGAATVGRTLGMFLRCATNMLIAQNTIADVAFAYSLGSDSATYSQSVYGLRIVNNIAYLDSGVVYAIMQSTPLPSTVVIDHNIGYSRTGQIANVKYRGATYSLATFTAWTGFEAHGSQADPLFVDSTDNDYHLRAGSPAIDEGVTISGVNDHYSGAAPDYGRFERH